MTRFLLDADIALYAIRRVPAVLRRLASTPPDRLGMSALVYSQLLQGVLRQPHPAAERQAVEALVELVGVFDYGVEAARCCAAVVAAVGHNRRHAVDRMIAAHAISLDATLVTNNTGDFAGIADLRVENWLEPA